MTVFTKALILHYFDPKRYIQIKTNASDFAINGVLSQLTLGHVTPSHLNQNPPSEIDEWHLVAFFSWKMIAAKIWYKTHDEELLAMVEAFQTWRLYLEVCGHKVLVLTDHNNVTQFIDIKSLNTRQVQ